MRRRLAACRWHAPPVALCRAIESCTEPPSWQAAFSPKQLAQAEETATAAAAAAAAAAAEEAPQERVNGQQEQ